MIDLPQLIYAYGISDVHIEKVYLVQAIQDNYREGNRPFSQTELLFRQICESLKVEAETIYIGEKIDQLMVQPGDILDIQVVVRNPQLKISPLNKILCAQVEHVNLMRPSLLRKWNFGLMKRWDLIRKLLLPSRIRTFYTLAPSPKKGLFFREKKLDQSRITDIRKIIAIEFLKKNERLKELEEIFNEKNLIFVLLRGKHFGGNAKWNKHIFEIAKAESITVKNSLVVIKNHPSDDLDYSTTLNSVGIDAVFLNSVFDRFIPMEILVEYGKSYQFIGIDSTVLISLQYSMRVKPIIVDQVGWKNSKELEYELGSIRSQFDHVRVFVQIEES